MIMMEFFFIKLWEYFLIFVSYRYFKMKEKKFKGYFYIDFLKLMHFILAHQSTYGN